MVLTDRPYRRCLRTVLAFVVGHLEANLRARDQVLKPTFHQAVAVKINFFTGWSRDETIAVGENTGNSAVEGNFVRLYGAADAPGMVLKTPLRRSKGVADRNVNILVGAIGGTFVGDDDLIAGYADCDTDGKQLAFVVAAMRRFDDHSTTNHSVEVALKVIDPIADIGFDRVRSVHVAETQLKRILHLDTRIQEVASTGDRTPS